MRNDLADRRLRAGLVGGGRGAFIGRVHRMAAELDGQALVVAGALSSDPELARASASDWFLDRSYDDYEEMAHAEASRSDGIDFVIIATPNHLHYPIAKSFLERGIAVVCDKPLCFTVREAEALVELVTRSGHLFALTHNYTGYPAIREARDRVQQGLIGELRKVVVHYLQDWLLRPLENTDHKQAGWRMDPSRAGIGGCIADIGTHVENLLEFVSGRPIEQLCADLSSSPGRRLDDDANILLRLRGGAKGVMTCSQVACGEENDLCLRLYGSSAALEWRQQDPGTLIFKPAGGPWERLRAAGPATSAASLAAVRLPAGHPEGFIEAFANLYRDFIKDLRHAARGEPLVGGYPTVYDGLRGMQFIARAVESSQRGGVWLSL